jgi:uncharacterized protein YacL (UPF0231 family)
VENNLRNKIEELEKKITALEGQDRKQLWSVKEIKCVTSKEEVSTLENEYWILIETVSTNEGLQYVMGLI